ncbi:MAG: hypothetical protein M1829_005010 [Trizodia sp. TS-e1964]|nr:MAG: hypothetical protein M1829_005010 [Trizodia sp. TS-e1964]
MDSPPPPPRRTLRDKLRQATFIQPRTGERIRRNFTLQNPRRALDGAGDSLSDNRTPLLGQESARRGGLQTHIDHITARSRGLAVAASSRTGQAIFKCSLSYLMGSMAVFVPAIAATLGRQGGKHLVAIFTVYFHPGRSQGSMIEAMFWAAVAFLYSVIISFASMEVSVLSRQWDLIVLGRIIVLLVFCGGGLGFIAFVKQSLQRPLVNVACSLASLAIITVLTKENSVHTATFSYEKVVQVMKMVVMGTLISTVVCFTVKPVSARRDLRDVMSQTTDAIGQVLATITRCFLNGSETEMKESAYTEASKQYKAGLLALAQHLQESKLEHFALGTEKEYWIEKRLVGCLQRLAQNIGGLRSAAATQFSLLAQVEHGTPQSTSTFTQTNHHSPTHQPLALYSSDDTFSAMASIDEWPEVALAADMGFSGNSEDSGAHIIRTPTDIFEKFITHLGPSMKSLAYTLKEILGELPFTFSPHFDINVDEHFKTSVTNAIELYGDARAQALGLLYKSKELSRMNTTEAEADFEEVAASCGHFSFSLLDFAEQMSQFIDILEELKFASDRHRHRRSWNWLLFWRERKGSREGSGMIDPSHKANNHMAFSQLTTEVSSFFALDGASDTRRPPGRSPEVASPEKPLPKETLSHRLWKISRIFRRDDVKFATKVGIGAAIYALPSFLPSTRPLYLHWRGNWGLISYMVVCSMTIGASNTTSNDRFLGTCLGTACAVLSWLASQGNCYALAFFGWVMALYCFYIIIGQRNGAYGRFILLTYNLTALYAYSLSIGDGKGDKDEGGTHPAIGEIAIHRVVSVASGGFWALVITRIIWPISARKKLKNGLSLLWLRMSLIWKRDPLATLLEGDSPNVYMNLREEFELQQYLSYLDSLRTAAAGEFELRGPFQAETFERILRGTGKMLANFHAMNIVLRKELRASDGEASILHYTTKERAQLCARIGHLFHVLASCMKLECPLNDTLPSTENARDRLLAKIFSYRKSMRHVGNIADEDFAILYAYALVTRQLSAEIAAMKVEIELLYGVLDEDALKLE